MFALLGPHWNQCDLQSSLKRKIVDGAILGCPKKIFCLKSGKLSMAGSFWIFANSINYLVHCEAEKAQITC